MNDLRQLQPAGEKDPRKVADVVNEVVRAVNRGQLQPRTVAELASEERIGGVMFLCTDETGGAVPVFCDANGGDFRRVTDRAVAS